MNLNKVTITGVDELTNIEELISLSAKYPYVEWGVLFSNSNQGLKPRYPKIEWIQNFVNEKNNHDLNIAAHLCGQIGKSILVGDISIPKWVIKSFQRFQLNAVYPLVEVNKTVFWSLLNKSFEGKEIIFQLRNNEGNDQLFYETYNQFKGTEIKIVGLVYNSGGKGKEITKIPTYDNYPIAYAGGLNPDNVESICKNIYETIGQKQFSIDMESGVRDDKDYLDLKKVEQVLSTINSLK